MAVVALPIFLFSSSDILRITNVQPVSHEPSLWASSIELGELQQSSTAVHVFSVVNDSATDVRLTRIRASCGCVSIEDVGQSTLKPNEERRIRLEFTAPSQTVGEIEQMLHIEFENSYTRSSIQLPIHARIAKQLPITVFPTAVDCGESSSLVISERVWVRGPRSLVDQFPDEVNFAEERSIRIKWADPESESLGFVDAQKQVKLFARRTDLPVGPFSRYVLCEIECVNQDVKKISISLTGIRTCEQ